MVKPEHRRELAGVGLLALALFILLALVPARALLGDRLASGNLLGVVGGAFQSGSVALLGLAVVLLPLLVGVAGVWIGRWTSGERALRLTVLGGGLLLLLPTFLAVLPVDPVWAGWVGVTLAGPLRAGLGGFGTGLLVVVLFVLLSMATLGWNPLVAPGRWGVKAGREGWAFLVDWLEGRREALTRNQASDAGSGADEGPTPARRSGEESDPVEAPAPPQIPIRTAAEGELPEFRDPLELEGDERPPLDLLTEPVGRNRRGMERELDQLGDVLVEKLRTFNVEGEIGGRTTGPVVTQYEVVPAPGVKVNRIANLEADLALAMRARTIRIVAPIPGKGAVGVEIPNPSPQVVQLREVLESDAFRRARGELPLALGKDLHGSPYVADLARMPHALIAGATGSGKSVCLNTVITSLVYRHTPETLRLLLIDPKMVELSTYGDLPHLRHPVVTDPKDAAGVLKWAVLEMERRYELLSRNGVRSIGEFNRRLKKGVTMRRAEADGDEGDPDRWVYDDGVLPYVVLIVDELADLMMAVQGEVERPLTLLAQKARAIGIHLIVATQRPSVNVITGLIKANFPCRIAFRVSSKTDSRTILDQNGADALLGNGDMLFLPPGQSTPVRVQGAYISTEDTDRLMGWFRELRARRLEDGGKAAILGEGDEEDILEVVRAMEAEEAGSDDDPFDGEWDEYFQDAGEICISQQQGSTSLLQRKLRIGYGRAARIVDQLHEAGVVGPPDGSKPREVLMNLEQFHRMLSGGDEDDAATQ
jgi:DNA segregation ATPase FtsK/SpoIIIE, S-DNA-T family